MKRLIIPIIVLVVLVAQSAFFVVNEAEQALVTEFGKPVGEVRNAGIHFKIPVIQEVHRFSKRILNWDADPNQIPTSDKKYIWVDTTARWRIVDPLRFFTTVATERGAQSRLDDIIDSVVRDAVSGHLLVELVRGDDYQPPEDLTDNIVETAQVNRELVGREDILANILAQAKLSTPEYGIELIDVQIKRINYVEQVRKRVYERMISERKKVAAQYRSEGEGEKADILGQMDKELKKISSESYRKAVEIRGHGDAQATTIYAAAYNQEPDFYRFLRTLESYQKTVNKNNRLILSTDSAYYKLLNEKR
ncbi:protease modulator HflC [Desulfuromonas acetoxidans]|uniref:Protein HflC n=1 Tax=Desulfuromonas acetoxidans (strain DSM 684 / 11070) TaxID=281689 RepID=Q1JXH5_DESA6|nr:protease modulator HflC [Desulfuromonas acetoxidans]EAT14987.1 HflC protein [Desulfuromonas acetoxidans DSM 684]MBF0646120.1 protease modulator HflC [Desulfuromonas acetoxidans]NVD25930.1 protease modulator HflC [Desulfuromonas acetoxidans]NVE17867.1 protease modulator HflC [Desulfuromonas acetoxidans]